jgi:hypothetical protein
MRRIVTGALIAGGVAASLVLPPLGGIEVWKYVLGAVSLWLFVLAGRANR